MSADALTCAVGFSSFVLFLIIQMILLRRLSPEQLLKSLALTIAFAALIPGIEIGVLIMMRVFHFSLQAWACIFILSTAIYILLAFVYILCVFGPYETSVRMRLVREIGARPDGITAQELHARYNAGIITRIRLKRLLGSGDIRREGEAYHCRSKQNIFFLFDAIAGVLKKWIG